MGLSPDSGGMNIDSTSSAARITQSCEQNADREKGKECESLMKSTTGAWKGQGFYFHLFIYLLFFY